MHLLPITWRTTVLLLISLILGGFIGFIHHPPVVLANAEGSGSVIGDSIEAQVSFGSPPKNASSDNCTWHVVQGLYPIKHADGKNTRTLYYKLCNNYIDSYHWINDSAPARIAEQAENKVSRLVPMLLTRTAPAADKMVVNVGTWFWVPRAVWKPVSVTAYIPTTAGPIVVTTTATPSRVIYTPGDGSAAVSCKGPGTPWSRSRGDRATSNCMYTYKSASHTRVATTYRSKMSIKWNVSWRSNIGAAGPLPSITLGLNTNVRVRELQALSR
jgi:hypothetical protein